MKEIKAFIKTHKPSEVALALHKLEGLTVMGVSDVRVFGRSKAKDASPRIIENLVDYLLDIKIEIVCQDQVELGGCYLFWRVSSHLWNRGLWHPPV